MIGVDIDIRKHVKKVLQIHKFLKNIMILQGSSNNQKILSKISKTPKKYKKILVCLNSNHTHLHVLQEVKNYNKFVLINS